MSCLKSLILLCVTVSLLGSGCTSVRVTTDLKPESDPTLKSPAGTFYVAGLRYSCVWYGKTEIDEGYGRRLLPVLRKECINLYPMLFAQDSANSSALWVEINDAVTIRKAKLPICMICTAFLAPLIFPGPGVADCDRDIDLTVGMWNGRDGMGSGRVRKDFRREQRTWGSALTPLGLIDIPGKSDFPKVSEAFNMGMFAYDDIPQVAQQVATAVAKLVTAQNSAIWTTTGQGPGDSGAQPAAIPPPRDLTAPF